MIDLYHQVSENIRMQKYNPRIDPEYLEEILNKENSLKGGLLVA